MIKEAIYEVVNGRDLTHDMAKAAMDEIMSGTATPIQISGFLTALRLKGETVTEITACAEVMREKCLPVQHEGEVLEIVGTGGDEANTFNISTTSGFVVAAAGIPVAKHGNRSVSSKCGAADCLEALGVKLDISPEGNKKILQDAGMCFMFAQAYHASMKYAASVRKDLGVRTIFNILGPLANPAGATMQLMGVYDKALILPLAQVLVNLGVKNGAVVCGSDGLDEITLTGKTYICFIHDGKAGELQELDPKDYGMEYCQKEELVGGLTQENAEITRKILAGEKGAKRDVVLLNSAACLKMAMADKTFGECIELAKEMIDSGKAMAQLEKFVAETNKVA